MGYHRAEVIGALVSILIVWALTLVLVLEAIDRFVNPPENFNSKIMMWTAFLGILVNIFMGFTLHQGTHKHFHTHIGGGQCSGHHHGGSVHHHSHEKKAHGHNHNYGHYSESVPFPPEHKGDITFTPPDQCSTSDKHHHHKKRYSDETQPIVCCQDETCNNVPSTPLSVEMTPLSLVSNRTEIKTQEDHSHMESDHHHHTHEDHNHMNVNVRAAFVHVIGDLIQSIGVFFIAVVIYYNPGWTVFDPICTFIFSIIVLFTTIPVSKDCLNVLMEKSPKNISVDAVAKDILMIPEVTSIKELRVWSVSEGNTMMCCRVTSKLISAKGQIRNLAIKKHIKNCIIEVDLEDEENSAVKNDHASNEKHENHHEHGQGCNHNHDHNHNNENHHDLEHGHHRHNGSHDHHKHEGHHHDEHHDHHHH